MYVLGGNFIPELLFVVCIFTGCWLSVAPFTDLFCGYVQEGMLANVESWEKCQAGRYDLSNPPGDIVRREGKLSLAFVRDNCVNCMWDKNSVANFIETYFVSWHAWNVFEKEVFIPG